MSDEAANEPKSLWQEAQDALGDAINALEVLWERDEALGHLGDKEWADGGVVDKAATRIHQVYNALAERTKVVQNPNDPRPGWGAYHGLFQGEANFVWDFVTDVLDVDVPALRAQDRWPDVVKASRALLHNSDGCERLGYYLAQYLQNDEEV